MNGYHPKINKILAWAIPLLIVAIFIRGLWPIIIIIVLIIIFKQFLRKRQLNLRRPETMSKLNLNLNKKIALWIIGGVIVILLLALSIVVIPVGVTGVYHLFGKVRDQEFHSGIHLKNPLAKITKMSIRTEEYTMTFIKGEGRKFPSDTITALTKEGLKVDLDITVLYHLIEEKASDIFKKVGLNYEEKIIRPAIRSGIREVIARYEAKDIYSEKRQEAANQILAYLKERSEPRGIFMEEVLLRNVSLPEKLAQAIEEKLQAEQEAQRMQFILQRETQEAERKRIEARGQRDAQSIINESLTTRYLNYLYIKELKEREGTIYVPISPSTGMPMFREITP